MCSTLIPVLYIRTHWHPYYRISRTHLLPLFNQRNLLPLPQIPLPIINYIHLPSLKSQIEESSPNKQTNKEEFGRWDSSKAFFLSPKTHPANLRNPPIIIDFPNHGSTNGLFHAIVEASNFNFKVRYFPDKQGAWTPVDHPSLRLW